MMAVLFSMGYAWAQDLITTREGKDIQAKIIEVTSDEIKYKKYNNQEGPTFTLKKSEVLIVRYSNGENEVFANETKSNNSRNTVSNGAVHDRMLYAEYKDLYDSRFYRREYGDPYSPALCGIGSFFIPGLGQGFAGEWGRGLAFFGAHIGIAAAGYLLATEGDMDEVAAIPAAALLLINDIWSIVDAVKVAKIKNMYIQDIRKMQSNLELRVTPTLMMVSGYASRNFSTAPGIALSLSF